MLLELAQVVGARGAVLVRLRASLLHLLHLGLCLLLVHALADEDIH